jgi:hypothetical protein
MEHPAPSRPGMQTRPQRPITELQVHKINTGRFEDLLKDRG